MKRSGIGAISLLGTLFVFGSARGAVALGVGDKAPDFTLPATTQEKWHLGEMAGKKSVVLFGFIGAFTST